MEYLNDYSIYIDSIAILILLVSTLLAMYRGFLREILGLGSWILAVIAVIYAIPAFSPITEGIFESKIVADIVVGIVVAITVLVICTLISYKTSSKIRASALSGLDRILGALFGFARGVLIVLIAYIVMTLIFTKEVTKEAENSLLKPYLDEANQFFGEHLSDYSKSHEGSFDDLFQQLNQPKIKASYKADIDDGYLSNERKSLNKLILETSDSDVTK